jgi:hypothetical protein
MDNHIEIAKEDIRAIEYAFRPFVGAPKPPQRSRSGHGGTLKTELSDTVSSIISNRQDVGIDAENLVVLQLSSAEAAPDVDVLQNKLHLALVEEVKNTDGTMRYVVQFANKNDIAVFEHERALWENDNLNDSDTLAYAQRRDLFACIESIRPVSPEDRTGRRLSEAIANGNLPDGMFIVDIDVWFDGDVSKRGIIEGQIKKALGTGKSTLFGDLFMMPNLLLGRAKVNVFTLKVLRKLDLIAQVDFPIGVISTEQCELYSAEFVPVVENTLDENAPLACVVDSGVFSGNPLLSKIIVAEEDFDLTEETTSDLNGHGTGVAGITAYGDLSDYDKANHVFKPLVRICNGKVMHNNSWGAPDFDENKRPEEIVSDAIRFFNDKYHCRVFNLSIGVASRVYNGGRQMTWASLLDILARELDVVIVLSAGNVSSPDIPVFTGREDLMENTRNQLLSEEHRLIDPATAALSVTVGSITRYAEPESFPNRPTPLSVGDSGFPSAFTRTGEGVSGAIKPEFVDFGGNYALSQMTGSTKWNNNRALNEPTLNNTPDKVFKGWQGTSFAAPHVTHIAARLQRALFEQLGEEPTANLIRALLASSAKYVKSDWLNAVVPVTFVGQNKQPQEWRLRLSGYGKVDDTTLFTDRNHITLFTEDALDLRQIHLYKIPVPPEFLKLNTSKRIAIGFAYNPPTRLSRKDYIANSLWFEVLRRLDADTLVNYFDALRKYNSEKRKMGGANVDASKIDGYIADFAKKHPAPFKPGSTEVRNSTLQQRIWEKGARGGSDLLWEDNDPCIYVLVTGKAKFSHPAEAEPQPYAIAVTFSFESEEDIQLRQKISEQAKIKQREQIRVRTQIQV